MPIFPGVSLLLHNLAEDVYFLPLNGYIHERQAMSVYITSQGAVRYTVYFINTKNYTL